MKMKIFKKFFAKIKCLIALYSKKSFTSYLFSINNNKSEKRKVTRKLLIPFSCCFSLSIKLKNYFVSWSANDAPTNALINFCGRFGREINSGWNWHPTKNFFSGSSTISTKRLSGETPEKTNPCSSNI